MVCFVFPLIFLTRGIVLLVFSLTGLTLDMFNDVKSTHSSSPLHPSFQQPLNPKIFPNDTYLSYLAAASARLGAAQ